MSIKVERSFRPALGAGRIVALPRCNSNIASTRRSDDRFRRIEKQMNVAATKELEIMKLRETASEHYHHHHHQRFPKTCHRIMRNLPGNEKCVDCGQRQPEWASISHGTLLCICCAGQHRALGVNTSKVRSVSMDSWTYADVVAMLEGGNDQLASFYTRHYLCRESYEHRRESSLLSPSASFSSSSSGSSDEDGGVYEEDITIKRYRTKAGLFYRKNLGLHVQRVLSLGVYKGREAYRGNKQG